ncbi:hypothetical protein ACHAXS_013580, partial [Conticribra weissflogii]
GETASVGGDPALWSASSNPSVGDCNSVWSSSPTASSVGVGPSRSGDDATPVCSTSLMVCRYFITYMISDICFNFMFYG